MDLRDRSVWSDLVGPLERARAELTEKAATCESAEHPAWKGKLEGLKHALWLLTESRARLARASGDAPLV